MRALRVTQWGNSARRPASLAAASAPFRALPNSASERFGGGGCTQPCSPAQPRNCWPGHASTSPKHTLLARARRAAPHMLCGVSNEGLARRQARRRSRAQPPPPPKCCAAGASPVTSCATSSIASTGSRPATRHSPAARAAGSARRPTTAGTASASSGRATTTAPRWGSPACFRATGTTASAPTRAARRRARPTRCATLQPTRARASAAMGRARTARYAAGGT